MTATAFPASEDFANGSSVLSSSAPLHLSLVESSSDRVYGTFEVSVIDVESENERDDDNGSDSGDNDEFKFANQNGKESEISPCGDFCHSQDCCFLMAFLCAPIRLRTYKALLFHVANFLVAVVSTACMTASSAVKLLAVCGSSSWRAFARRFESQTLSTLLQVDTALFNFVSPLDERVRVYSPTMDSFQDASEYVDLHVRLYFGVVKLACSSVPGVISAGVFLWSLQHLFLITACALSSSSSSCDAVAFDSAASALHAHFLTTAEQDLDVLVLLAVLAVYGAAMLLQAFAYISRHVTVFFCAEYLRFAD